ncbi:uncharacterized protein LOC134753338 isoform X1 [Cydia strobilella]|uniref:uncharacterized protein LOC134753338 isoform X1 n=1 Tax=Cydia strobilella TaxID=1100964 RepID=UPI003004B51A
MNEQKTKKTNSIFQHIPEAPQRRVSFSKPSKFSKLPSSWQLAKGSTHGATEKSTPVPRVISFSRPSKSSLKQGSHNKAIGVCTRNKKRDATSSTTVDTRRRLQDPTPTHLKYGTFRRLSKLRQSQEDPLLSPRCESRPIVVARSSVTEKRSPSPKDPLKIERSSITPPTDTAPLQHSPLRRPTRRVYLSRTEPIHLDIKPKSFPSMLWC